MCHPGPAGLHPCTAPGPEKEGAGGAAPAVRAGAGAPEREAEAKLAPYFPSSGPAWGTQQSSRSEELAPSLTAVRLAGSPRVAEGTVT